MPPKSKFTEAEVVAAAIEIVERDGFNGLTARTLAAELHSSARPVFTVFDSMDDLTNGVIAAAKRIYDGYVDAGLCESHAFKGVGEAYIRFAAEHPKLFAALFMREQSDVPDSSGVLGAIDGNADRILDSIVCEYGLSAETAKSLYLHLFTYTHGIATMIATKVCSFTVERISEMLTEVFTALLKQAKAAEAAK